VSIFTSGKDAIAIHHSSQGEKKKQGNKGIKEVSSFSGAACCAFLKEGNKGKECH